MLIETSTVHEREIPFVEIESFNEELNSVWMMKISQHQGMIKAKAMAQKDLNLEPCHPYQNEVHWDRSVTQHCVEIQVDPGSLLAILSGQNCKLQVQWDTLSHKIRWRIIEEDT